MCTGTVECAPTSDRSFGAEPNEAYPRPEEKNAMTTLALPTNAPAGPVIVHTDAAKTRSLTPGQRYRWGFLAAHLAVIDGIVDGRAAWFPTFNYDFLGSGIYSIDNDHCQVGSINEFERVTRATWRSRTPVFNFAGAASEPEGTGESELIFPFDPLSPFGQCAAGDGTVLWYGAPFSSATILHHSESIAGGPPYRFDKDFRGVVRSGAVERAVTLRYHVRPRGRHLDYDWERIIPDAMAAGIIRRLGDTPVYWASAGDLVQHWANLQLRDPLALLDVESRDWVEPLVDALGRRFVRSDFEEVQE